MCIRDRTGNVSDGIPHLHIARSLDARNDIPHISCAQFRTGNHIHFQHTDLICIILDVYKRQQQRDKAQEITDFGRESDVIEINDI